MQSCTKVWPPLERLNAQINAQLMHCLLFILKYWENNICTKVLAGFLYLDVFFYSEMVNSIQQIH